MFTTREQVPPRARELVYVVLPDQPRELQEDGVPDECSAMSWFDWVK